MSKHAVPFLVDFNAMALKKCICLAPEALFGISCTPRCIFESAISKGLSCVLIRHLTGYTAETW